ncbi:MAG: aspartate 1-decarboxylase [Deltaproteobacteria bacterium]|nr:aspartate 1-decarboxylase [Deltaproteobacteria bacterium]
MHRWMMKSKIHRAAVTGADLNYEGSITVDQALLEAAGLYHYEMVQIYNVNSGARFETYVIPGAKHSGVICLNGAAARLAQAGDKVIIVSTCWLDEKELAAHKALVVLVDDENRIKQIKKDPVAPLKMAS